MSCIGAFAQETDLSAQQSEIQTVNPVPGHKIDHKGLIINPTPHEMRVDWTGSLNIGEGFRIVGSLENTDRIMKDTFWVGVYPGMTDEIIDYMAKTIKEAL